MGLRLDLASCVAIFYSGEDEPLCIQAKTAKGPQAPWNIPADPRHQMRQQQQLKPDGIFESTAHKEEIMGVVRGLLHKGFVLNCMKNVPATASSSSSGPSTSVDVDTNKLAQEIHLNLKLMANTGTQNQDAAASSSATASS